MSLLVQCKHFCHSTQDTLLTTRILKQSNKAKAFFIYVHMINSKGQFIIISGRVMSLKLARVSSTKSEKQYSFYIHWFWQSLLLQKACQILIPTWLKIRDKQWISIQIISSSVQTFSLVFRKIYIFVSISFVIFSLKTMKSQSLVIWEKSLHSLPFILLSIQCYFWQYSKVCQILDNLPQITALRNKIVFEKYFENVNFVLISSTHSPARVRDTF